jgi:hypothetical protein
LRNWKNFNINFIFECNLFQEKFIFIKLTVLTIMKYTATCCLCLIALIATAQQKELTDFNDYTIKVSNDAHNQYNIKNYALALSTMSEWLTRYDQLSPGTKVDVHNAMPGVYYNLACYAALSGKKEDAINFFDKAIKEGFADYTNAVADSDLMSLHKDKRFKADLQQIREKNDYAYILKQSGTYNNKKIEAPVFTYQDANAPELVNLRKQFNLDSVAGTANDTSKLKRLLYWAHNSVKHDGNRGNPNSKNAVDLIAVCKKENRGVNCRMMATIYRDACQAEGFTTRIVTCMPKDTADFDCHVITVVWVKSLNKWVWMDPTFNAYVKDDKGTLLNIEEVRERLVKNMPLVLNNDANWNNIQKKTKAEYLDYYMTKNLYWLKCSTKSEWDLETRKPGMQPITYIDLYPGKYTTIFAPKKAMGDVVEYATNNPAYFWEKPAGE